MRWIKKKRVKLFRTTFFTVFDWIPSRKTRVFSLEKNTKNYSIMLEKMARFTPECFGCVCGERMAEKAYTASTSQAGSGEETSNFEFRHGAIAPRLTDRGRPSTTPSDIQQHSSSSSSTAVAAPQPRPQQQQQQRARGRRWRRRWPRQMSCGTAARPGSITTIITTTTEQPIFYQ